jgi:hypothetical protein
VPLRREQLDCGIAGAACARYACSMRRFAMKQWMIALAVTLALPSMAQQDTVVQEADKTVFNKKTVIDFSDVNIEGELTKPEGSYIKNRKKTRFRNLIELRGHFKPELKRSVSSL